MKNKKTTTLEIEKKIENESLDWLNRQSGVFAIKIDNSAPFNEQVGARIRKSMWQPKGIGDALVMLQGGRVFWIEFKTVVGKQRMEQKSFEKKMLAMGINYYVCRDLCDTQNALEREMK